MKKIGTILCLLLLTFLLEGCRMVKIKEADREPLKYTVVEKQQLPEEAAALIEEKKEKEFQMAYQRGSEKGGEPSYPWIAVKIPYREGPVEFD